MRADSDSTAPARHTVQTSHGTTLVIEEIEYHRNGIGGVGFYVVKFSEPAEERRMLAVLFTTDEFGYCAVFNRSLLAQDIITFGVNSWRGDHYETALRAAILQHEQADQP